MSLRPLLRHWTQRFLNWLYTRGAWAYDLVAALASLGRWNAWVRAMALWPEAFPQALVLELGCGPGHLMEETWRAGFRAVGLDLSRAMLRQAQKRLRRRGFQAMLVQARAQALPFPEHTFDRIVATFPTEYIFDIQTQREIARVLRPGGRVDVLMEASSPILTGWARLLGTLETPCMETLAVRFRVWTETGMVYTVRNYPLPGGVQGWVVSGWKPEAREPHDELALSLTVGGPSGRSQSAEVRRGPERGYGGNH